MKPAVTYGTASNRSGRESFSWMLHLQDDPFGDNSHTIPWITVFAFVQPSLSLHRHDNIHMPLALAFPAQTRTAGYGARG